MGLEAIGNNFSMHFAQDSFAYSMLVMVEEVLEMAGTLIMMYTLLHYAEELATARTASLRSSQRNAPN
jgi:hypothetical protein